MSDLTIRVQSLGKEYKIGGRMESYLTLREQLSNAATAPLRAFQSGRKKTKPAGRRGRKEETFWALQDITFDVHRGEVVGIIGRNGAGKSTLLKILSRITDPSVGSAEIRGRVGSLLEVGTGFHPELTGRENISLSGAILGMKQFEVQQKFDEIVAFAEVEKFIDTPVKRYSSGMYLRLAFAVAAHLEPEILLVDEVLAVGDAVFQKKCIGKMENVARSGRTVLFVSHNLATVNALCDRGILLDRGKVVQDGPTADVLSTYGALGQTNVRLGERTDREGSGEMRFTDVAFESMGGERQDQAATGQGLRVLLTYETNGRPLRNVDASISVRGALGELFFLCNVTVANGLLESIPPKGTLRCTIPKLPLTPALYNVGLWCQVGSTVADRIDNAAKLEVISGDFFGTGKLPAKKNRAVLVDHQWDLA